MEYNWNPSWDDNFGFMNKRKIQSGQVSEERFNKIDEKFDRLESKIDGIISVMATKDDLKKMASKDDLKKAMSKMVTKEHFDSTIAKLVTRIEFDDFKEYISENMYTKADQDSLLKILDPMALGFKNAERVGILTGKQLCDMDDKINNHDQRIRVLEQKV